MSRYDFSSNRRRGACKFVTDALLHGDFKAFSNLVLLPPATPNCTYPSDQPLHLKVLTNARVFTTNHPIKKRTRYTMDTKITKGMPVLHQVIIAEGSMEHNNNKKDYTNVIRFLVKEGADINSKDALTGKTALHYATELCRDRMIKLLVNLGGNMKMNDFQGKTPWDLFPKWCVHKHDYDM